MDLAAKPPDRSLPPYLAKLPIGVEKLAPDLVAAHRRRRVVKAAIDVFAARGYRATTIDDLTSAAQAGVGSFYALFDGKEDCFLRAYDTAIEAASKHIAAALPADASWPERIRAALEALLAWIAAEPRAAQIVLVEAQTAGPGALARYQATLERLAMLLRAGRTHGSVSRELPESFEYATVTGVAWLLHDRLVTGEVGGVEALLPDLVEIVVEPYFEGETQTTLEIPEFEPDRSSAGRRGHRIHATGGRHTMTAIVKAR